MSDLKNTRFSPELYHDLLSGKYEPAAEISRVPDFELNPLISTGELLLPVIDRAWLQHGGQRPVWPGGKEFAVCITHDVDAVSTYNPAQNLAHIKTLIRNIDTFPLAFSARKILARLVHGSVGLFGGSDDLCNFEKWMEVEDSVGAKSTFFFAPGKVGTAHTTDILYVMEQKIHFQGKQITLGELMGELTKSGWEIGPHPSWSSHNDLGELRAQKKQLDQLLNGPIQSVRQHYLKFDPNVTHRIQAEAGFKYDSTMGYNNHIGFRRGTSYPFPLKNLKEDSMLPLIEIPLSVQDGALIFPLKGMQLNNESALEYIRDITNEIRQVGGVLNLLWHPNRYHEKVFWELFIDVVKMLKDMDPWFATIQEAGELWGKNNIDLMEFTKQLRK